MYKLKSIARRGTSLGAAIALAIGTVLPAVLPMGSAYADALNPLTKRSLTLSSSSPGWSYTDGSGNSTYAPPNSGANGKQTGNTFSFNVSTDTSGDPATNIKTMSFQYCTKSAGQCTSPGDGTTGQHADLEAVFPSPAEVGSTDFGTVIDTTKGTVKAVPGYDSGVANDPASAAKDVAGNFVVFYRTAGGGTTDPSDDTWAQSTGWSLTTANAEDGTGTGKNNFIILTNDTGLGIPSDTTVRVIFFGTNDDYITNPGSGAFFVKLNTYKVKSTDLAQLEPATDSNVIDGGVTVANVMNQSIQITTKVLETMQFSVGTVDPDTLSSADTDGDSTNGVQSALTAAGGGAAHTPCDPILMHLTSTGADNVLPLGDQTAESSLTTDHTYITHSYWRLSSNSSAGATVYYSGHTLSNTEGDQIQPIGTTPQPPTPGGEQFGLAFDNGTSAPYSVDYSQEATQPPDASYENAADNNLVTLDPTLTSDLTVNGTVNASYHTPQLAPLVPDAVYADGSGTVNSSTTGTKFAFDASSDTIPAELATESDKVVDCVTAKMRYIANIAAITPAGIYTTKINYIAAPQY